MTRRKGGSGATGEPVTLKVLAAHLRLDPATVSVVLNDVPGRSIPEATRERIRAAARKFDYQPSFVARSLRNRRTMTIGILVPVLADGYHAEVMSGIGDHLLDKNYFYFIAHHRHRPDLIQRYPKMLVSRGTEGIIAIDTRIDGKPAVPTVTVAGHKSIDGVANVVLDHRRAAELILRHLYELGHRKIAFMRGQPFSSDSAVRWQSLAKVAREMGLAVQPELTIQLTRDLTSPELGYPVVQQLLALHRRFTALVCFNDMAAIGAIRALHDAQLRVPQDISVVGFDDIPQAAFQMPSLTTIRQPLHTMGKLSAELLLQFLRSGVAMPPEVAVEPELIVRESTAAVRRTAGGKHHTAGRKQNALA
ncbi:MAG: LacI family DNA-binding transcriptional regulator [Acidobacteriaceae bacterium]